MKRIRFEVTTSKSPLCTMHTHNADRTAEVWVGGQANLKFEIRDSRFDNRESVFEIQERPERIRHMQRIQGTLRNALPRSVLDGHGPPRHAPRMLADRTGSLAGIKRDDYLPFGEEIPSGVGPRTTTNGYAANDNVRQQFTQKERDDETGLDYFHARH
jgi:hypothetical protein